MDEVLKPAYRFRLWSTVESEWLCYCDSQNDALALFNNYRNRFDRIDYHAYDGQGWRYVDPDVLNSTTIDAIYEADRKHDGTRRLIFMLVGIVIAAGALIVFFW